MDTEDIKQLAAKERKKARIASQRENEKSKVTKKTFIPREADSWKVYKTIRPRGMRMMLWIYFVLAIGFVFLFIWLLDGETWAYYASFVFFGAFALRYTWDRIKMYSGYSKYKKWCAEPGFPLKGWNKLGSTENFPRVQYWDYETGFKVELKQYVSVEASDLVHDSLLLFMKEANDGFYESGIGEPGRHKWEFITPHFVKGSADPWVLGEMYWCMAYMLQPIQDKFQCINGVEIDFSGDVYEVEPKDTEIG